MSDSDRLDQLLVQANPVDEARLPLPVDDPQAQLVYEKITGTPYAGAGAGPRRRRFGTFMAAIAALAIIGGGAAYAGLRPAHVTAHLSVACYGQDQLGSRTAAVSATAAGPIAACAGAWAAGQVGRGPVPLLAACVGPTGVAAVFPTAPGADVCAQLGLARLPVTGALATSTSAPPTTSNDVFLQARAAIVASLASACLDRPSATRIVEQILERAGLTWTVRAPAPFPPERPCASPGFDEQRHIVVLVGIPPRP